VVLVLLAGETFTGALARYTLTSPAGAACTVTAPRLPLAIGAGGGV
jgi:hypothetical protein